jgi:hypothetical protein
MGTDYRVSLFLCLPLIPFQQRSWDHLKVWMTGSSDYRRSSPLPIHLYSMRCNSVANRCIGLDLVSIGLEAAQPERHSSSHDLLWWHQTWPRFNSPSDADCAPSHDGLCCLLTWQLEGQLVAGFSASSQPNLLY